MVLLDAEVASSGAIRPQVVGDQSIGNERMSFTAACLSRFDWTSTSWISPSASTALQIDQAAIDLDIDLIKVPARVGLGPASTQVRCDQRAEVVYPAMDS